MRIKVLTVLFLAFHLSLTAKSFVVGSLMGQLGNQMFIIAATEALARENNAIALFPDLVKSNNWNIQENREKIFFRLNTSNQNKKKHFVYSEPCFQYKKIPFRKGMEIKGYFQSEKYFKAYKNEIINLFSPSAEIVQYLKMKYDDILMNSKTVSIHFRDYIIEDPEQLAHPNCTLDYFRKAIAQFPEDTLFVVFSNKIKWCKENFSEIPRKFKFIEGEHFHHDFFLMSMCKHNIISNSTYSWWAAYLNKNPNKTVIAPKQWFANSYEENIDDLLPEDWLTL